LPQHNDANPFKSRDDAPKIDPEDDLPAGFSAFHQRFPAIVSPHFRDVRAESKDTSAATPENPELEKQIDDYLDELMRPRP
jgi:hypothetical protein